MKYSVLILCICSIACLSCSGNTTKYDSLKEAIVTFKHDNKTVKPISIFPELYAEVQNDTTLSNGYRVKIKNFTNMDKLVALPIISPFDNTQHFREISSEITVYKNNKIIYKDVISNTISEYFDHTKTNIKHYLNNGISVDEAASLAQNKVIIITSNSVPVSRKNNYYRLSIDARGNSKLKKIENART
jgi:hypothetical protein